MEIATVPIHPKDINTVILGDHPISIPEFVAVARYGAKVSFSQSYCDRVKQSRHLIEKFLNENRIIYGVTTGFGSNVTEIISTEDAETLQRNIVRSHAVSVGGSSGERSCKSHSTDDSHSFGAWLFWGSLGTVRACVIAIESRNHPFCSRRWIRRLSFSGSSYGVGAYWGG